MQIWLKDEKHRKDTFLFMYKKGWLLPLLGLCVCVCVWLFRTLIVFLKLSKRKTSAVKYYWGKDQHSARRENYF